TDPPLTEQALETAAVPLGLGMFAVLRHAADREDLLERQSRRTGERQSVARSLVLARHERLPRDVYAENAELLDDFWAQVVALGRPPKPDEYDRLGEIRRACGSIKAGMRLLLERYGEEALEGARQRRREDLLVYLALAKFGQRRIAFGQLSLRLRRAIDSLFGSYGDATREANDLLFQAGKADIVEAAARELDYGWFEPEPGHFTFHRSLLDSLPALLRVYVGCASQLYGDVREADLIKIHLRSQKLTCMFYESFERRRFPRQLLRVKIDFGRLSVCEYPARPEPDRTVLLFKERFVSPNHPARNRMAAVSAKLRRLGFSESDYPYGIPEREFGDIEVLFR
ncbi:MAG: DNA phosphorothioation-associated putative methyltransferase, partial [Fimbriimonadaceae bacterium]